MHGIFSPPPPPYIERIYLFSLSITLTWPINLPFKQFQQKNTFTYRVEWPLSNFVRIEKVYKMFDVLMKTRKIPDQKETFNGKNGTKNTQLKNENVNKCSGKSHKQTIKVFVAGSKMSFHHPKKTRNWPEKIRKVNELEPFGVWMSSSFELKYGLKININNIVLATIFFGQ